MNTRKIRLLLGTITFRKVFNFARLYATFHVSKVLGRPFHGGSPAKIGVEPTTSCNLRCPECPSGLRSFTRPTGMLGLEEFKSMTNELYPDLMYMLMYFQGEPYLNPNFLEMARHAVKKGVFVATSTNGHYLNEEMARKTVESGIQEVLISVDGATQETYEQYRVGGQLDKVLQGVRNLVSARAQANSVSPVILLQFLVVGPNEHEIQDIKRLGKSLGVDEVLLKTAQIYDFESGSPLIPQNTQFSRYSQGPDGSYRLKNKLRNQCWKLWMGAEITWDGRVLPCCFDKDAQYVMGRLTEESFHTIWRSQAYRLFRQNILKSRKEIDICKNCSEGTKVWT